MKKIILICFAAASILFSCKKTTTTPPPNNTNNPPPLQDCSNGTTTEKLLCNDGKWKVAETTTHTRTENYNSGPPNYTPMTRTTTYGPYTTKEIWTFTKDNFVQTDSATTLAWSFKNASGTNKLSIGGTEYTINSSQGMNLKMSRSWYYSNPPYTSDSYSTEIIMSK